MSYFELNREIVKDYVRDKIDLLDPNDELTVYEFGENEEEDGDGFVNFVYRVSDQHGHSVIVKQAKEVMKKIAPTTPDKNPIKQDRNLTEARVMQIKHAIVPEYIPDIYWVDKENHIYICEDCGKLRILRFEMMKGNTFENFPEKIGEYLAKTNFYTSEIYMDAVEHRKLQAAFLNESMRLVFEIGLFLKEESAFDEVKKIPPGMDPARIAMSEYPWKDENFRTQLLRLRQLHMKKAESLVHGDLHTSNILLDNKEMKVIDQEYTYMGLSSCDTGYLMGSLLYEYIRWFFGQEKSEEEKKELRETYLGYIRDALKAYQRVYRECWEKDAKPMYRERIQYREQLMRDFMHEVCGATGTQIISRIGGYVPLPDFDSMPNEAERLNASRIAMWTAKYLIENWEQCDTVDQLIDMIEKSVRASLLTLHAFNEKRD